MRGMWGGRSQPPVSRTRRRHHHHQGRRRSSRPSLSDGSFPLLQPIKTPVSPFSAAASSSSSASSLTGSPSARVTRSSSTTTPLPKNYKTMASSSSVRSSQRRVDRRSVETRASASPPGRAAPTRPPHKTSLVPGASRGWLSHGTHAMTACIHSLRSSSSSHDSDWVSPEQHHEHYKHDHLGTLSWPPPSSREKVIKNSVSGTGSRGSEGAGASPPSSPSTRGLVRRSRQEDPEEAWAWTPLPSNPSSFSIKNQDPTPTGGTADPRHPFSWEAPQDSTSSSSAISRATQAPLAKPTPKRPESAKLYAQLKLREVPSDPKPAAVVHKKHQDTPLPPEDPLEYSRDATATTSSSNGTDDDDDDTVEGPVMTHSAASRVPSTQGRNTNFTPSLAPHGTWSTRSQPVQNHKNHVPLKKKPTDQDSYTSSSSSYLTDSSTSSSSGLPLDDSLDDDDDEDGDHPQGSPKRIGIRPFEPVPPSSTTNKPLSNSSRNQSSPTPPPQVQPSGTSKHPVTPPRPPGRWNSSSTSPGPTYSPPFWVDSSNVEPRAGWKRRPLDTSLLLLPREATQSGPHHEMASSSGNPHTSKSAPSGSTTWQRPVPRQRHVLQHRPARSDTHPTPAMTANQHRQQHHRPLDMGSKATTMPAPYVDVKQMERLVVDVSHLALGDPEAFPGGQDTQKSNPDIISEQHPTEQQVVQDDPVHKGGRLGDSKNNEEEDPSFSDIVPQRVDEADSQPPPIPRTKTIAKIHALIQQFESAQYPYPVNRSLQTAAKRIVQKEKGLAVPQTHSGIIGASGPSHRDTSPRPFFWRSFPAHSNPDAMDAVDPMSSTPLVDAQMQRTTRGEVVESVEDYNSGRLSPLEATFLASQLRRIHNRHDHPWKHY